MTKSAKCVVAALYKFAKLPDFEQMRNPLLSVCAEAGLKGTILLANEGINGTVAGTRNGIDTLLTHLRSDERLKDIEHKESYFDEQPFLRMKVRLKKEIVALGVDGVDPLKTVGTYVEPKDWNKLISDPEVTLLDTRNKYEYIMGTFEGAVDPKTDSFKEFPGFCDKLLEGNEDKEKKIAMFCTGGIRCEKSTSYLRAKGYKNIYHLKGGILKYLEEIPEKESMWKGECFVFDDRVSVVHDLKKGKADLCGHCGTVLFEKDQQNEDYVPGAYCYKCKEKMTEEERERLVFRAKQYEEAKEKVREQFKHSIKA